MTLNQIPFTAAANLTRDPELRYTPSGKSVAAVRLAITPPAVLGRAGPLPRRSHHLRRSDPASPSPPPP
jgi:hypothetical protein